ncbi:hypothetical protein J7E93_17200 [Streptomyces sp. ISL-36]|uniref:hypothetical protein n=1 Tax=Streptomyces sp. ISL-36 TaxID=2819182 RepID=UPI001BE8F6CF|nr:hypothetical protein [Streptomyces sp. ISL-36]MBT2441816.1 hypothetical protein [Streptomyces sp. ISL-36]
MVTGVVWLALDQTVRQLGERAADGALRGTRGLLRRVFRRNAEPATVPPLTPEQLAEVRQRVLEVAAQRGLERERAETIAEAVVVRLVLGTMEAVPPAALGELGGAADGGTSGSAGGEPPDTGGSSEGSTPERP